MVSSLGSTGVNEPPNYRLDEGNVEMDMNEQFNRLLTAKEYNYSWAELTLVSVESTPGAYSMSLGMLKFHHTQPVNRDIQLDYGNVLFERGRLAAEEAVNLLRSVQERPRTLEMFKAAIPHCRPAFPKWANREMQGLPSPVGERRLFPWPSRTFALEAVDSKTVGLPPGPIVNTRLPVVGDTYRFLDDFFDYPFSRSQVLLPTLGIFFPDYRARFRRVVIDDESVCAEYELGTLAKGDLVLKGSVDGLDLLDKLHDDKSKSQLFVRDDVTVQDRLEFYLLDRTSDDLIDWVSLSTTSTQDLPEVEYSSNSNKVQRLIRQGENERQEFKREIGDGQRFIESVIAFANTHGGTIFLGVDDDGAPHALNRESTQESIERKIRDECDPPLRVEFENSDVSGTPILLVKVPEGVSKPYVVHRKGKVLVRGGRTNFAATSQEIREMTTRL